MELATHHAEGVVGGTQWDEQREPQHENNARCRSLDIAGNGRGTGVGVNVNVNVKFSIGIDLRVNVNSLFIMTGGKMEPVRRFNPEKY